MTNSWIDVVCDDAKAVVELLQQMDVDQASAAKVIYKGGYSSYTVFYPTKEKKESGGYKMPYLWLLGGIVCGPVIGGMLGFGLLVLHLLSPVEVCPFYSLIGDLDNITFHLFLIVTGLILAISYMLFTRGTDGVIRMLHARTVYE